MNKMQTAYRRSMKHSSVYCRTGNLRCIVVLVCPALFLLMTILLHMIDMDGHSNSNTLDTTDQRPSHKTIKSTISMKDYQQKLTKNAIAIASIHNIIPSLHSNHKVDKGVNNTIGDNKNIGRHRYIFKSNVSRQDIEIHHIKDIFANLHAIEKGMQINKTTNSYLDQKFCKVDCKVGFPCKYKDEVDLRVLVLTYNRADSLRKCLDSVGELHGLGHRISVEIWVDRAKSGIVDPGTLTVAEQFRERWKGGRVCVHVREKNAFVGGQWIDTWRPRKKSKEIALILEDDIDVSPYAYKWLRAAHQKYGNREDIAGYTLQMEHTFFSQGMGYFLEGPKDDLAFLYGVIGTWGFSPHPVTWRKFQDWFHTARTSNIKPYVPKILPTVWYKFAEKMGSSDSMWEMWHIYHSYLNGLSTLYCNLHVHTNRTDVLLSHNRKENGLHWTENEKTLPMRPEGKLLRFWNDSFVNFAGKTVRYIYNTTVVDFV